MVDAHDLCTLWHLICHDDRSVVVKTSWDYVDMSLRQFECHDHPPMTSWHNWWYLRSNLIEEKVKPAVLSSYDTNIAQIEKWSGKFTKKTERLKVVQHTKINMPLFRKSISSTIVNFSRHNFILSSNFSKYLRFTQFLCEFCDDILYKNISRQNLTPTVSEGRGGQDDDVGSVMSGMSSYSDASMMSDLSRGSSLTGITIFSAGSSLLSKGGRWILQEFSRKFLRKFRRTKKPQRRRRVTGKEGGPHEEEFLIEYLKRIIPTTKYQGEFFGSL